MSPKKVAISYLVQRYENYVVDTINQKRTFTNP